jgi:hypothetical protein
MAKLKGVPTKKNPKISAALKGNDNAKGSGTKTSGGLFKSAAIGGTVGGAASAAYLAKLGLLGKSKAALMGMGALKGAGASVGVGTGISTIFHAGGYGLMAKAGGASLGTAAKMATVAGLKAIPAALATNALINAPIGGALGALDGANVHDALPSMIGASAAGGAILGGTAYGIHKGVKHLRNRKSK